ncbi:MAG: hypothetical protein J7J76_07865 [Candidatus Latescibacteria bacterium]|nr:hypothetical protein [Candidatus Latescibacterota bacterium]
MRFKELLIKELKQERAWLLWGSLIVCGYEVLPFIKTDLHAPYWLSLTTAPLIIVAFAIQAKAVNTLRNEWNSNSVQLLFSLPVRGYHFVITKFVAQAAIVCSYSLLSLIFLLLICEIRLGSTAGVTPIEMLKCWLLYLLFPLPAMGFFTFSYVAGRCSPYVKRLVSVLCLFTLVYLFVRLSHWGQKLFAFLPKLTVTVTTVDGTSTGSFSPSGIAFFALFGFVLLVSCCFIIEKVEL